MGHTIDICPHDPNLKTKEDVIEEYDRIAKLKDYKRIFADTVVTTTLLLKKCIKVPKVFQATTADPTGLSAMEAQKVL